MGAHVCSGVSVLFEDKARPWWWVLRIYRSVNSPTFSIIGPAQYNTNCIHTQQYFGSHKNLITDIFSLNTLRPRQNGCHFPDDILKWIFLDENIWISIKDLSMMYRALWDRRHEGAMRISQWLTYPSGPWVAPAISSLWLRDVWMTEFWNFFQISVHCANLCMIFHAL